MALPDRRVEDSRGGGWKQPCFRPRLEITLIPSSDGRLETPVECRPAGRYTSGHSSQGRSAVTLYGYARVSVREPEDKNLDLQVERLVRAGCSLGNMPC